MTDELDAWFSASLEEYDEELEQLLNECKDDVNVSEPNRVVPIDVKASSQDQDRSVGTRPSLPSPSNAPIASCDDASVHSLDGSSLMDHTDASSYSTPSLVDLKNSPSSIYSSTKSQPKSSDHPSSSKFQSSISTNAKPVRRTTKQQIQELEAEAGRLVTQLFELQNKSAEWTSSSAPSMQWRAVATEYSRKRARAEKENAQLRKLVKSQDAMVQELATSLEASRQSRTLLPVVSVGFSRDDVQIFQTLYARANGVYGRVQEALVRSDLSNLQGTRTYFNYQVKLDAKERRCVEFNRSQVLPFDCSSVADVAWKQLSYAHAKDSCYYFQPYHVSEDTCALELARRRSIFKSVVHTTGKSTLRRFWDGNRCVIVWVSESRPVELSRHLSNSCGYDNFGWIIIAPEDENHTRINSSASTTPIFQNTTHERASSQFTTLVNMLSHVHMNGWDLLQQSIHRLLAERRRLVDSCYKARINTAICGHFGL